MQEHLAQTLNGYSAALKLRNESLPKKIKVASKKLCRLYVL